MCRRGTIFEGVWICWGERRVIHMVFVLRVLMHGVEEIGKGVEILWLGRREKDLEYEVEGSKLRRCKKKCGRLGASWGATTIAIRKMRRLSDFGMETKVAVRYGGTEGSFIRNGK